jgi:hypothetical protein
MGTSRASKDLLMLKQNDLSNYKGSKNKEPIRWIEVRKRPDTNPNSMANMQKTIDATRKANYRGSFSVR